MAQIQDYKIATIGSHTALQILKGAKDEGFETICVCEKGRVFPYEHYGVADEIIEIDKFQNFKEVEAQLMEKKAILIPHGSFVTYFGAQRVNEIEMMYYGDKAIIEWEEDRKKEREWLLKAGLQLPEILEKPEDIDRPVIIKFHGAKGGKGYFIARTPKEFYERYEEYPHKGEKFVIQEYIVGVPIYTHYFYSPVTEELEIMSFDKRYESNADSIGRIAAKDQLEAKILTSYTIVGNMPLVLRESLLPRIFENGQNVVKAAKEIVEKGLFGPFCLEAICDPDLNFYVFEISARIVAGTNPYTDGSPYTWLRYNEPMSTGRRIARDIKQAIERDELDKVLG